MSIMLEIHILHHPLHATFLLWLLVRVNGRGVTVGGGGELPPSQKLLASLV